MSVLEVKGLCKAYPSFRLENVALTLEEGRIMGFIGRNGAGKTTTLKSLTGFVHPDAGEICYFGLPLNEQNERSIKERIGFVSGGANYYPKKKLSAITAVTRRFYPGWDEEAYRRYCELFKLTDDKTPDTLSAGMNVKYALALALSHGAKLLLLDEPTSGLDPVSRDEVLDVFLDLAAQGVSILFSTHITADLDKCADDITYIRAGHILTSAPRAQFEQGYRLYAVPESGVPAAVKPAVLGQKRAKSGATALVRTADAEALKLETRSADLEEIMVHLEKGAAE